MNLEDIMLSEISQRKTNTYDFTHVESKKNKTNKIKQKQPYRYREKISGYQRGRRLWHSVKWIKGVNCMVITF